jgi:hypothetical protein
VSAFLSSEQGKAALIGMLWLFNAVRNGLAQPQTAPPRTQTAVLGKVANDTAALEKQLEGQFNYTLSRLRDSLDGLVKAAYERAVAAQPPGTNIFSTAAPTPPGYTTAHTQPEAVNTTSTVLGGVP